MAKKKKKKVFLPWAIAFGHTHIYRMYIPESLGEGAIAREYRE